MRKINKMEKIYSYPYGVFYDVDKPESMETSSAVIIYSDVEGEMRVIGSLEGVFVSLHPLWIRNPTCSREQAAEFEKKYRGKFSGFK
jgi:hypothetical protein